MSKLHEISALGQSIWYDNIRRALLQDIAAAADLLRPVYEGTSGVDGYISLEVSPTLARDSEGTVQQARRLFAAVGRPNVMIASVASFFVSRVDSTLEKALSARAPELLGRIAIANAQVAYMRFRELFAGPRWQRLVQAGANVQRPLWASTGVKNPAWPDLDAQFYHAELGDVQAAVTAAQAAISRDQIMSRIWAQDHTVWKPEPAACLRPSVLMVPKNNIFAFSQTCKIQ